MRVVQSMNLDAGTRYRVAVLELRVAALKYRSFVRKEPASRSGVVRRRKLIERVLRSLQEAAAEARRSRRVALAEAASATDRAWFNGAISSR